MKTIHPPGLATRHRSTALALLALAAGVATTRADPIVKEATFGTLATSDYSSELGFSARREEFRPSSSPTLTADFSTLGDTTFTFTWKAPEGQAFELYVPTGLGWETNTDYVLQFDMQFNDFVSGLTNVPTFESFSFGGASGEALSASPSDYNVIAIKDTGAASTLFASVSYGGFAVGERYRFQSATLTVSIGASYTGVFNDAPLMFDYSAITSEIDSENAVTDPGQILRLVAVPEPASAAALFGLAALGAVASRRQRRA